MERAGEGGGGGKGRDEPRRVGSKRCVWGKRRVPQGEDSAGRQFESRRRINLGLEAADALAVAGGPDCSQSIRLSKYSKFCVQPPASCRY
eukprot:2782172-Pleurochrysis_carterae.AAC.2